YLNRTNQSLNELLKLKKPEQVIWPNSDVEGWGILALDFLLALIIASNAHSGNGIGVFVIAFLVTHMVVMISVNLISSSGVKNAYQGLIDLAEQIESELKCYGQDIQQ